jgi:hypothetical protein
MGGCLYFVVGGMIISSEEFMLNATAPAPKKSRSPKRPDPITIAAQSLVAVLEALPKLGNSSVTLMQLIDRIPGLTIEVAQAALQKPPAKTRIVVAIPTDSNSPLVLKENLEALACEETFLRFLAEQRCTADVPVRTLDELTKPLHKSLKKLVDHYWPANVDRLPAGLSPMSVGVGKKKQFALHDERFPLPEAALSQKLTSALQRQKDAGEDAYPATWPALIQSIDEVPNDEQVRRATLYAPFVNRAREISTKECVWIALLDDVPEILRSESFLRRLIQQTCQAEVPEIKLTVLAKQLPKDLQPDFLDHWLVLAGQNREFDFVSLQRAGTSKKPDLLLRDRRFPPAELVLAENLVKILVSQKAIGGHSYPTTWQRLIELAGTATQAVRDKAARTEPFQSQVICSLAGDPNSPLALLGDESRLANSSRLLSTVLGKLRSADNHVIGVEKFGKFKGIHPVVAPLFQVAIENRIREKALPEGIGALKVSKKWGLFLQSDAVGDRTSVAPSRATPFSMTTGDDHPTVIDTANFERDFDAAFAKLDGKLGLPNYASLVDLRPALIQYPRELFDQELLKLRRAGRYSLSLVEGRFGLSADERVACLVVDHISHLLVQKKHSS